MLQAPGRTQALIDLAGKILIGGVLFLAVAPFVFTSATLFEMCVKGAGILGLLGWIFWFRSLRGWNRYTRRSQKALP